MINSMKPSLSPNVWIPPGGRVTLGDWVTWPIAALAPAAPMFLPGPHWIRIVILGFTVYTTFVLALIATASFDPRQWVDGARIQLPMILIALVTAEVLTFSSSYWLLSQGDHASFSAHLSRIDSVYFSLSTFTTTGFGDIHAVAELARAVVSTEMVAALVTLVVFLATAVSNAFGGSRSA